VLDAKLALPAAAPAWGSVQEEQAETVEAWLAPGAWPRIDGPASDDRGSGRWRLPDYQ